MKKKKTKKPLLSALLVAFVIGIGAYYGIDISELLDPAEQSGSTHEISQERILADVVKVIDGDTIKINYEGKEENIRFLLIDTPEMRHKQFDGPQPYAVEAKEKVEELLKDGKVEIELGIQERDKYGRLLGYLYVDGVSLQEVLLEEGLARVAYVYNDKRHLDDYLKIEKEAKKKKKGIWSIEDYVTDKGYQMEQ